MMESIQLSISFPLKNLDDKTFLQKDGVLSREKIESDDKRGFSFLSSLKRIEELRSLDHHVEDPPSDILDSCPQDQISCTALQPSLTESSEILDQSPLDKDSRLAVEPKNWTPFILRPGLYQNERAFLFNSISTIEKPVFINLSPIGLGTNNHPGADESIPFLKNVVTLPFVPEENLQAEGKPMFQTEKGNLYLDSPMSSMVQEKGIKKDSTNEFILSLGGSEKVHSPEQPLSFEREAFNDPLPDEFKWIKTLITEGNEVPPNHGDGNRNAAEGPSPLIDLASHPSESFMSEAIQKENANSQLKIENLQINQEIGEKIIWSLKNNEGRIRFTIEPPELGHIYMEIKKDRGNIQVALWAEHTMTKEILETNQIQLYKILKEDGFTLDKFDVFVQQDMKDFQDWEKDFVPYGRKSIDVLEENQASSGEYLEGNSNRILNLLHRGNQYVDLFV